MLRTHVSLTVIIVLVLGITSATMACCGNCHSDHHKKASEPTLSEKDSVIIQEFSKSNEDLLAKIKKNNELIQLEYQKEKPNYDRIAKLKKQGVDYHTELEKREANTDLNTHHHCWCPMHQ